MKEHILSFLVFLFLSKKGWCQDQTTQEDAWRQRYICPPNFIRLGHSCYYFSSEIATWHNAHFECRDLQSQLASLESQWEDQTVLNYLNKPEFATLNRWVGGIYNWSTRQWTWGSSAEVMPYNGFMTQDFPTASRWHCVYLDSSSNYHWKHTLCTTMMHYICEARQTRVHDPNEIVIH
ncbi:hypothetical protein OTU49_004072 [Cherax quadricarinatus]|uniref:C-type lectin domain-containing protein n=1 Tax=Cherax quadricarinatus TaxID=27406 RepID=A0AAW0YNN6_CHEQU|nr:perlucin-like protein [Cherax quadricarinatus]